MLWVVIFSSVLESKVTSDIDDATDLFLDFF